MKREMHTTYLYVSILWRNSRNMGINGGHQYFLIFSADGDICGWWHLMFPCTTFLFFLWTLWNKNWFACFSKLHSDLASPCTLAFLCQFKRLRFGLCSLCKVLRFTCHIHKIPSTCASLEPVAKKCVHYLWFSVFPFSLSLPLWKNL